MKAPLAIGGIVGVVGLLLYLLSLLAANDPDVAIVLAGLVALMVLALCCFRYLFRRDPRVRTPKMLYGLLQIIRNIVLLAALVAVLIAGWHYL